MLKLRQGQLPIAALPPLHYDSDYSAIRLHHQCHSQFKGLARHGSRARPGRLAIAPLTPYQALSQEFEPLRTRT